MSASIKQIWNNVANRPKFVFPPTFIFFSPICPYNCGVVFLWKCIFVFEKWLFSFDRSNMQIFTLNITRVVWPRVTNLLDFRYFCRHNPLFYHLNLIPCHYWSWQRSFYFLVNIFVRHTFSTSKSSIKIKTVLTMTDMTESTELLAFERQKDGYKVTVKISNVNIWKLYIWNTDKDVNMKKIFAVMNTTWALCRQKYRGSSKFVPWGRTTRVILRMKICIFERSKENNHFSKTKIYFHKKTTPQLLGHIGLQNMKVGEKTNFGWLVAVCLMHVDSSS